MACRASEACQISYQVAFVVVGDGPIVSITSSHVPLAYMKNIVSVIRGLGI